MAEETKTPTTDPAPGTAASDTLTIDECRSRPGEVLTDKCDGALQAVLGSGPAHSGEKRKRYYQQHRHVIGVRKKAHRRANVRLGIRIPSRRRLGTDDL